MATTSKQEAGLEYLEDLWAELGALSIKEAMRKGAEKERLAKLKSQLVEVDSDN